MAPFIVTHPVLLHNWISAREQALARVRALAIASIETKARFRNDLTRVKKGVAEWHTDNQRQADRIVELTTDIECLSTHIASGALDQAQPWDALYRWAEDNLTIEAQELVVTLIIEPHSELVDELAEHMAANEDAFFNIDGAMTLAQLQELIEKHYAWALTIDFAQPSERARFWYVSEEKLEPRLGERFQESGAEFEQRLAFGHEVAQLYRDLYHDLDPDVKTATEDTSLALFLLNHPQHRHAVRRVQTLAQLPYADIRDNLISSSMLPIDLLRCKLSFFGATKFDPRSDRWVRITMYQDAPFPDEIHTVDADDWSYPPLTAPETIAIEA